MFLSSKKDEYPDFLAFTSTNKIHNFFSILVVFGNLLSRKLPEIWLSTGILRKIPYFLSFLLLNPWNLTEFIFKHKNALIVTILKNHFGPLDSHFGQN